jgi:hypothetical protein
MPEEKFEDVWSDRLAGMRCKSCIYFVKKAGANLAIGRCRKRAPTINGYPVVMTLDWCGDHKLNEDYVG